MRMERHMKRWKNQRGVALLFSLFTLFLLTAIAFGMVFMTNTETSVDSNYRSDQALYFAAKAGLEEARNRMMLSNPNSLFNCAGGANTCLPATAMPPGGANNY